MAAQDSKGFIWNEMAFEAMADALRQGATSDEALGVYRMVDSMTAAPQTIREFYQPSLVWVAEAA